MLHITRDFITLPSIVPSQVTTYFHAIFLRTVMQYTVVGNTSFNLDGGSFTLGSGTNGTISSSGGYTNRFTPDSYTVSSSDINRILVIRSTIYPLSNSGLWRVYDVDTVNNQFILGLRGEPPIASSGMTWRLHPAENSFTFANGNNSNTTQYRGRLSASTTARIILQSPHSTAYQVRLTYEAPADFGGNITQRATIAPGFGGDSIGDFQVGGQHLHAALYYNVAASNTDARGLTVGLMPTTSTTIIRYYIWGEDTTGTMIMVTRTAESITNAADTWCAYGLPEDEEYPNDTTTIRRLFAYGSTANSNQLLGNLNWASGPSQGVQAAGVTMGYCGRPISVSISPYCTLSGQPSTNTAVRHTSNVGDNPFLNQTELQTVDLVAGTWDNLSFDSGPPTIFLEPRRLGRFPIARLGRSNFGNWSTTTDVNRSWIHTLNGVYLPWYGSILP